MVPRKLYAGAVVRRLRETRLLTQAQLAEKLGLSTAYLSQIENNQRPLTAQILIGLSAELQVSVSVFSAEDPDRLTSDLREILADPMFRARDVGLGDIKSAAVASPWLARTLIDLHASYRRLNDRLQIIDENLSTGRGESDATVPLPFEEVRNFFHYTNNYIDPLDRAAEALAAEIRPAQAGDAWRSLGDYLVERHGVRIRDGAENADILRSYDETSRVLTIDPAVDGPTRCFIIAYQIGLMEQQGVIDEVIAEARFQSEEGASICRIALANYFAAALIMPYGAFLAAARSTRHDLERMSRLFGASLEQIGHRLSTLQRPGDKGIPLYFVKVDRAGNIIKRHSATRFHFARFGGACPLWNVHEAFELPDRLIVQHAAMPDGTRYLCIAKCIVKPGGRHGGPSRRYAIGVGCEVGHAEHFVYADGIDLKASANPAEIGVSCRICERPKCPQRALPPLDRALVMNRNQRGILPYHIV
ncbi:MAG: short-chain fatty acyl-CoA regulator family protein [Beijerinckiaceae bacterium]|nr:short-chain fatty acyl-CoA regulator family protein [Beijerinckiaceae bacterium]